MRFFAAITALLSALSLCAQTPTGQIFGTAHDPGVLTAPGVRVHVLNELTGQQYEATTNEAGDYAARALPSGRFTITAEKYGFKKFVRQDVSVTALKNVRVDISLEVGAVNQSVVVQGEAPLVDTRTVTVGTLIDDKRILDLPLSGRNVISFASLVPGVSRTSVSNTVSSGQQNVNVNGNRSYSTNMQLDGGGMYHAHRGQGLAMPPPDAVQEIKMVTSGVTAEYGRGTGITSTGGARVVQFALRYGF